MVLIYTTILHRAQDICTPNVLILTPIKNYEDQRAFGGEKFSP